MSLLADDDSGTVTQLGTAALPTSNVTLEDISSSASGTLQVAATDSTGTVQVRGASLDLSIGGLAGETLDVYVQRIGQSSLMPNPLTAVHVAPQVAISDGRYIAAVDPTDAGATIDLYDLLAFAPTTAVTIARAATSLVTSGTLLVAIDPNGATYVDLLDLTTSDIDPPTGATSFADVAGGETVYAPTGVSYVVGATRPTGNATAAVLVVAADGTTSFSQLVTPRLGAAAAYVTGRGLVVAGGSADPASAGAEILGEGAATASALTTVPTDPTTGAGAVALDGETVLVAGGVVPGDGGLMPAPSRVIDLACTASCVTTWIALPETFTPTSAFLVDGTAGSQSALIVGDNPQLATHAVLLTATTFQQIPLQEPRQQARAVALPTQGIAIVGGTVDIESYLGQ